MTFEIRKSADDQWYWVQKAANGEVLSTSETYTRLQSALEGAQAAGAQPGDVPIVTRSETE